MRNLITAFALLLFSLSASTQNITGIWRGTLSQELGGCFPVYNLELQLEQNQQELSGKSFDFFDQKNFVKHHFKGRINNSTGRLMIFEDKFLLANIPADCTPCTKTYSLNYQIIQGKETLTGEWKGIETNSSRPCPPGKITLYKVTESAFPIDIEQPETLTKIQKESSFDNREKEIVKTVDLKSQNIQISLYDNAEIDNDTISVFLNGNLFLHKQRLTDKPLNLSITAFENKDYELVMYAENLGQIPPNTALMIITDGKNKYEIRLASTQNKSSAVRFRYKPEH